MLGSEFRKLRKAKKMTISDTAQNITSTSSLQRWECGHGQMSIEKVIELLDRIHIQPKEYIDKVDISHNDVYSQKIGAVYAKNDTRSLRKITIFLLNLHSKELKNKHILLQAAVACNYYLDLTNINLFPQEDIIRLESYFSLLEDWTQGEVILFGNTQLLMPALKTYRFARSLYSYLIEHREEKTFTLLAVNALLNEVFILLKKRRINLTRKLLSQVQRLSLPEEFSNEIIRIKFMNSLLLYVDQRNATLIDKLIKNMKFLGMKEKANDFEFAFKQIKHIYDGYKL